MIRHFYLLYYNHVKWAESTRLLNNPRRFFVASNFVQVIAALWILLFLPFVLFLFPEFMDHEWLSIGILCLLYLLVRFLFGRMADNRIRVLESEYRSVRNWRESAYRKRALFYTVFYFVGFPVLIFCAFWILDSLS